jgi:hypothetical protein
MVEVAIGPSLPTLFVQVWRLKDDVYEGYDLSKGHPSYPTSGAANKKVLADQSTRHILNDPEIYPNPWISIQIKKGNRHSARRLKKDLLRMMLLS